MSTPQVSVIMAVLNGEAWIPTSVPDILNQSMSDLELLVIDDGSTDGTLDAVAAFSDARLRVERLEHVGLADALNHGISVARGRYIARMDVDDRSSAHRLEAQLAAIAADAGALAAGCSFDVVDGQGVRRSTIAPPTRHEDICRRLFIRNPFAAGSMLFEAEALRDAGGYRAQFTSAEDYELLIRLSRRGRLTSVAEPLYRWRVHDGNMSLRLRERELRTVGGLHDELWRSPPRPRARRELTDRLDEYVRDADGAGRAVASQLLQTEVMLAKAMLDRHRRGDAARQAMALGGLPPRQWSGVFGRLPTALSQALGQRARARKRSEMAASDPQAADRPLSLREYVRQDAAANPSNPKGRLILAAFRLAQRLRQQPRPAFLLSVPYLVGYRIVVEWILGVELPWNTQVGAGLRLFHGQALVVNDESTIGKNCTLRNSTTLGHVTYPDGGHSRGPTLGDGVDVGCNVVILGEVHIGDGAVIGAGSVVVHDVPARSVVVGNPARVMRSVDDPPRS